MGNLHNFNFIETLREQGITLTSEQEKIFKEQIEKDFKEPPYVGVFGKTGAGKSSLVNAIYGKSACSVSDIESCTRNPQSVDVGGVYLVDFPGIGESKERDEEYMPLYQKWIPKLNVVFWVLQANIRAYGDDIEFYKENKDIFENNKCKVFFVVNQIDSIGNFIENRPTAETADKIERKCDFVANCFSVAPTEVFAVSADTGYGLIKLVNTMLTKLDPKDSIKQIDSINPYILNEPIPDSYEEIPTKPGDEVPTIAGDVVKRYLMSRLEMVGVKIEQYGENKGPIVRAATKIVGRFIRHLGKR